jgi:hypothetical protein
VPDWLARVYPEVFEVPSLAERTGVYATMDDLRETIQFTEQPDAPEWRPAQRLRATVEGPGYLRHILP